MADLKALNEIIEDSGMTLTTLSRKSKIPRGTLYNRLTGKHNDFSESEILGLQGALRMSDKTIRQVFLRFNEGT